MATTNALLTQKTDALCRQISGLFKELIAGYSPEPGSEVERALAERIALWAVNHPERLKLVIAELQRTPGSDNLKKLGYEVIRPMPKAAPAPVAAAPAPEAKPAKPSGKKGRKAAATQA